MPKPKGKSKTKSSRPEAAGSAAKSPSSAKTVKFVEDIDNAEGWNAIIRVLCVHLEIPDLSTRRGYKKIHEGFDALYKRMDAMYTLAKSDNSQCDEKVLGGLVGIWAKLCADGVLRDRLFRAGFLNKLTPLLEIPSCRQLALQALNTVTHFSGNEVRAEIAKITDRIVKCVEAHPEDSKSSEYAISTISHALSAVMGDSENQPNYAIIKQVDLERVLNMLTAIMRVQVKDRSRPDEEAGEELSYHLILHAISLLGAATLYFPAAVEGSPGLLAFLVAVMRSTDLVERCTAMGALLRTYHTRRELEYGQFDPQALMTAVQRGYPSELSDALMAYGPERAEITTILKTMTDNQRAFMDAVRDGDLLGLGRKLVTFVLRTEFSIAQGAFQDERGRLMDVGLPFMMWLDSLPHCAKALRAVGDEDGAAVLELKKRLMSPGYEDANEIATKALARNPNHAYFWYAITKTKMHEERLRAAKKGLKCKNITPFVRFALLQASVHAATDLAISTLQTTSTNHEKTEGGHQWELGVAFLNSAYDDAKTYINEGPPDMRGLKEILQLHILLSVAIRGPELSPDLRELDGAMTKLKNAYAFSDFLGQKSAKTQARLAQETITALSPTATTMWGATVAALDRGSRAIHAHAHAPVHTSQAERELAKWLADDEGEHGDCAHPRLSRGDVAMLRCSWCSNPSAALRKCSGCGVTRYCDTSCQKSHWARHKVACKKATSANSPATPETSPSK